MLIDRVARRYGQRPSKLLGVRDPWAALELDMAIAFSGEQRDKKDQGERSDEDVIDIEDLAGIAKLMSPADGVMRF